MSDEKGLGNAGFGFLLAALPELLRRAADIDCVCGNCENWMCTTKDDPEGWEAMKRELTTHAACKKLQPPGSLLLWSDGPPWRECRWFKPIEEFKKSTADRPKLKGDVLAEMERKSREEKP